MNMNDGQVMDKSLRSVFVGNIPYEATEEKLKDIFNEVGHVGELRYFLEFLYRLTLDNFSFIQAGV